MLAPTSPADTEVDEENEIDWYRKEDEKATYPWNQQIATPKPPSEHPLKATSKSKTKPPLRQESEEDLDFFNEWAKSEEQCLFEDWAMELEAGQWAEKLTWKHEMKKKVTADSSKYRSKREYERVVRKKYRGRKGQYQYGRYSWHKW